MGTRRPDRQSIRLVLQKSRYKLTFQGIIMSKGTCIVLCVLISIFHGEASPMVGGPPSPKSPVKMARYILHNSEWTSMSTIAAREPIVGYPFVNVFSVSDGPVNNSTGVPMLYLTDMEISSADLRKDPRASLTMSLAQSDYCIKHFLDPESPLCAHVIYTGEIERITDSEELKFAHTALFSRHKQMNLWPAGHGWFYARLNIKKIYVLSFFGGVQDIDLDEYFSTDSF